MGVWSPSLFGDDIACDIKHEYSVLLSLLQNNNEVEKKLIEYYFDVFDTDDEPVFWFSLAFCEWKKGLLSDKVKEKALELIDNQTDLKRWGKESPSNYKKRQKVLSNLREKLLSPMPKSGKIKKASGRRCPWKVGSLLAYQIISNEKTKEIGMYGKFALLRVIQINKNPISKIMPTEVYNENMLVGLYGWYGDEIPDESIVENLKFIHIEDYVSKELNLDLTPINCLPADSQDKLTKMLKDYASSKRVTKTCVCLSWSSSKTAPGNIVCIGHDESFENNLSPFFKTDITQYSFTHFLPFDMTIAKQLKKIGDGTVC